jgi:hypothetical protein
VCVCGGGGAGGLPRCVCLYNDVLMLVPIASENMIADIGTAARSAPAIKIASAAIYGDLASYQSFTLPLSTLSEGGRDLH